MYDSLAGLQRVGRFSRLDSRLTQVLSYVLALGSVALTAMAHQMLLPVTAGQPARIMFLLPVLISTYAGGLGPGLAALTAALVATRFYHLVPSVDLPALAMADRVRIVSLIVVGSSVVLVVEALHRSRKRARTIQQVLEATLAGVGDAVFSTDRQGRVIYLNREASLWTGLQTREAAGRDLADVAPLRDPQTGEALVAPAAEMGRRGMRSALLITASGEERHVEQHTAPVLGSGGSPIGQVVLLRDVSSRRASELALEASEQRYRMIAENISDVLWVLDLASLRFQYVSPSVERLRGYTVEEVLSQTVQEALTPESHEQLRTEAPVRLAAFEAGERSTYIDEVAQWHKDGSVVLTETHARYVRDPASGRMQVFGVSSDITARRKAERELNDSRQRYSDLFSLLLEGFAHCRMIYRGEQAADWIYLEVNPAFERLTGLRDVTGRRASELLPHLQTLDRGLLDLYGRVARGGPAERFETYLSSLNIWFAVSVYSPAPDHFVAVFDNISVRKKAEQDLRASEARLRLALESSDAAAWVWDLKTNSNVWSERLWGLYGIEPHSVEPCYQAWLESIHPEDRAHAAETINRAAESGHPFSVEWRSNPASGPVRWLLGRGGPVRDAEGHLEQYFGIVLDVTQQKRAEQSLRESEERFRVVFEESAEPAYLHGFDGRFFDVNKRACESLGYSRDELLAMDVPALDPSFGLAQAQEIWATVAPGHSVHITGVHRRKDGTTFPAEIHLTTFLLHGRPVYLATARDISERLQAEKAMQEWTAELESQVEERTRALQAANRELEAFSYSVSHDLRAPLRAVDGFARVVEDTEAAALSPAGKAYLGRVRAAAGRMGALIDDLLKLSRITRSDLIRQRVDLSALAHEVCQELREREPERHVECIIEPELALYADARLARILLENLLGNAWKFTARTEQPRVEVGRVRSDGETVYYVRDNGAGFEMQYSAKLFGAFQRLHTQDDFPGSGIGLATVQRIVTRHGGRAWAEGELGRGATIFFTFPE